jgi:hypothetical protein
VLLKLERKFGKYAIKNLMLYMMIVYALGLIVYYINPQVYYAYLMLDIDMVLKGQVWRIFTFLIQPMDSSLLLSILLMYVYYSIGTSLEYVWGTFRFNLFYFMGIFANVLAVVLIYIFTRLYLGAGISFPVSLGYLNMSMLLAFAATFPQAQFNLMFLIPIKAKWLMIGYFVILGYNIIDGFVKGGFAFGICTTIVIVVSLANFFVYFFMTRSYLSPKSIKRKMDFSRSYTSGMRDGMSHSVNDPQTGRKVITRHKCAVCGRTELDGANLEFRFCSKCNGNYEYCQDHLFTHEHVQ